MKNTLTTERLDEIAKLAIRLHQISGCAAVTSSGETIMHHTFVDTILTALHDVTAELLANREAQPVAWTVGGFATHDKKWAERRSEEDNLLLEPLYRHPVITGIDENHYDPELEPGLYVAEIMTKGGAAVINGYYTAPPVPANANPVAWEMRYWNNGYNMWGEWERITAEQHAEMSVQHAADNDYEFRVLYGASPSPAVPGDVKLAGKENPIIVPGHTSKEGL